MRRSRIAWLVLLAGLLVTFVVYLPGLSGGFYFDDQFSIAQAPAVHWQELSLQGVWAAATSGRLPGRSIANLSFGVNHLFGGLDPKGYHRFNLVVHLAVGLVLAWTCHAFAVQRPAAESARTAAPVAAALSATVFLVHPLNVQAVTYVVQRMTSLAALFSLLAFGCYLQARRAGSQSRTVRVLLLSAACVCWPLALMSKENTLILPAVVVVHELCFHRAAWRSRLAGMDRTSRVKSALAVVAIALAVVAIASAYVDYQAISFATTFPQRDYNGWERMLTQPRVHFAYATLLVWPAPSRLNLDHEFAVSRSLLDPPSTLAAVVFWLVFALGAIILARSRPRYGFPLLAYLLFHFVESGPLNIEMIFEHRMYLPMAALVMLLTAATVDLGARLRMGVAVATALAIVPLAAANHTRNVTWSDPLSFYRDCAEKSPNKYRAVYNYGRTLVVRGSYFDAVPVLQQAIRLDPQKSQVHNELALAYQGINLPAKAVAELQEAVRLNASDGEATYNLAVLLDNAGSHAEAARLYRHFLAILPQRMAAYRPGVEARLRQLSTLQQRQ